MIRGAETEDFDRLLSLYDQLHPQDERTSDGSDRIAFEKILGNPDLHLFVLEDDSGEIQATCYLNLIPNITRKAAPYGIIENVVTERDLRNKGLGKQVIQYALDFAWSAGCYKVMLQTGSRRESTHNFYKACGFNAKDKFAFVARPPRGA